jgi:iron complex transport system ATP-binding protein
MTDLLNLRNIDGCYGKTKVINGISLAVRRGELLALIGPNGAGKTSVVKIMCRTMKPAAGTVEFEGQDVWQMRARDYARKVAHVRQSETLAWPFTVEQVVLMGRYPHRGWLSAYTLEDRHAVDEAIELTGLQTMKGRALHTLSGGEAQRAMLARALAQNPELLILDEPVAHLDIKHQIEVLNTARSFTTRGLSVVICLHDLTLAALYADRVALLEHGVVRVEGSPEHVLNKSDLEEVYGTPVLVGRFPGINRLTINAVPEWVEEGIRQGRDNECVDNRRR